MILTGDIRSTWKKSVPVPCHEHKFHTDLPGIEPGPPFHLLVHVDHILFIFPKQQTSNNDIDPGD